MQITKEILMARMKEYQAQIQQLQANLNAVNGAIQDLQWAMTELDKPEPVTPDIPNPPIGDQNGSNS